MKQSNNNKKKIKKLQPFKGRGLKGIIFKEKYELLINKKLVLLRFDESLTKDFRALFLVDGIPFKLVSLK